MPRFGGFTKDAKKAADKATAKTIETAVIALITKGELTYTGDGTVDRTIYIANAAGGSSRIRKTNVRFTDSDLTNMIGTAIKSETEKGFLVTISSDGNVTCVPHTP